VRRLETLVLTHPHLDHLGGAAAVLRGVRVGAILDPGQPQGSGALIDALEAAGETHAAWSVTTRGRRLELDGMTLEVLHPSGPPAGPDVDPNEVSVVLLLRYGAFSALLTGDAQKDAEEELAAAAGPVQVLKVAHHGSTTSSSALFLERIRPALALVSVGRGNGYGHPAPEVVARLVAAGARVLRTDRSGEVDVRAREDGSWTVTTGRGPD
jgi:competence protein ComEC